MSQEWFPPQLRHGSRHDSQSGNERIRVSEEASYNVEDIVLRIREMVETSRPMPMSSSIKLNRDELLDLLDDAIEALPE